MLKCCFSNIELRIYKPLENYKLYESYNLYKTTSHKTILRYKLFTKTIGGGFFFTIVLSNIALSNQPSKKEFHGTRPQQSLGELPYCYQ